MKDVQGALALINGDGEVEGPHRRCEVSAEGKRNVELLDAYSQAVITVVEAVGPAVVGISVKREQPGRRSEQAGSGSGVIITPDGYILTNDHVVRGTNRLTATLQDGTSFDAALIGTDPATDLALIRAGGSSLPYAAMGGSSRTSSSTQRLLIPEIPGDRSLIPGDGSLASTRPSSPWLKGLASPSLQIRRSG